MQRLDGKPKKTRSDKKTLTEKEIAMCGALKAGGMTNKELAMICDMGVSTFERLLANDPELKESILKGAAQRDAKVTQSAYEQAVSGKSPTMTIFWLKCRRGWKEAEFATKEDKPYKAPDTLKAAGGKE